MVKAFCDVCGKELFQENRIDISIKAALSTCIYLNRDYTLCHEHAAEVIKTVEGGKDYGRNL